MATALVFAQVVADHHLARAAQQIGGDGRHTDELPAVPRGVGFRVEKALEVAASQGLGQGQRVGATVAPSVGDEEVVFE